MPGLTQSCAHTPDKRPHELDSRHAGQTSGQSEDQLRVQVANESLFDLAQMTPHRLLAPQEGQGSRIVAEEQHALIWAQRGKARADRSEM